MEGNSERIFTVHSSLIITLLWGAICAKIECDFLEVFFVDLPKIVQIVRDLVNGTLRFSKWDAAI